MFSSSRKRSYQRVISILQQINLEIVVDHMEVKNMLQIDTYIVLQLIIV